MNIDIGTLIAIFIAVALVNNLVFSMFLGICPFLGVSRKVDMAFGMGCAVTFVITLSGIVTWLIVNAVLIPLEGRFDLQLGFLKYVIFYYGDRFDGAVGGDVCAEVFFPGCIPLLVCFYR